MENEFKNERYALTLAEDGRIKQITYECFANNTMVLVDEIPEGDTYEYRYVNGEFIHDPLPKQEPTIAPTTEERVEALEAAVTMLCMPDVSEV